jgi:hypothetical protein
MSEEEFTFEQQEIADATKEMLSKTIDLSPFAAKTMQTLINKKCLSMKNAYPWAF